MLRLILILATFAVVPRLALADEYPVAGRFGVVTTGTQGPIDCRGLRIVTFFGERRSDTGGGVPGYRNRSVTPVDENTFDVLDDFTTGQVYYAKAIYRLKIVNRDRVELALSPSGRLNLQRCKP